MTIEEKAEEYRRDTFGTPFGNDIAMAFCEGAKWVQVEQFTKTTKWFTDYLGEIGYPDDWLRDSSVQQSGIERFRKAMGN